MADSNLGHLGLNAHRIEVRSDLVRRWRGGEEQKPPLRFHHPERALWKCRPTSASAGLSTRKEGRNGKDKTTVQLTDSFSSRTMRTRASLGSENNRLYPEISDRG